LGLPSAPSRALTLKFIGKRQENGQNGWEPLKESAEDAHKPHNNTHFTAFWMPHPEKRLLPDFPQQL
jgi:hypothetical protein